MTDEIPPLLSSQTEFNENLLLLNEKLTNVLPKLAPHIDIDIDLKESTSIELNKTEKSVSENEDPILLNNLLDDEKDEFKSHLKEEMNGLTLSILIEIGNCVLL